MIRVNEYFMQKYADCTQPSNAGELRPSNNGMAWGVNRNILDRDEYPPVILKAWNALVRDAVHDSGFLGWVQGTGKEPEDGQPLSYDKIPDFEDFGTGCFLLGASEVYKLQTVNYNK
jgi:hypothetical protein